MKNTIELIKLLISSYLVALAIVTACPPIIACDGIRPPAGAVPEILRYSVNGIAEFAEKESELCKLYPPEKTAYVSDLHGVQSRHSYPSVSATPRGNMPDYTRYKISRGHPVILASAWNDEHKVMEDVKDLGLQEVLKLKEEVDYGVSPFGGSQCQHYKVGNIAAVKRLSLLSKPSPYYFQKAFTPLVIYGPDCSFDMMIVIDDSGGNLDAFLQDVALTPYFSKLKKLVLFQVPEIDGTNLEIDWVPPALLPQEFRTLIYRPEGYVNPLTHAGYYPTSYVEEEEPAVISAEAPSKYVSPSRPVIAQGIPDHVDVSVDFKNSARMVAAPAPSSRKPSPNPLRQSGYHDLSDFDKNQKAAASSNTSAPQRNPLAQAGFYSVGDSDDEEEETAPSCVLDTPEPAAAANLASSTPATLYIPESSASHGGIPLTRSAERCRDEALLPLNSNPQSNSLTKSH